MTERYVTLVQSLVRSISSCCAHYVISLCCSNNNISNWVIYLRTWVNKYWNIWQSIKWFCIKTSLNWHIVSFNFSPSFFQDLTPYIITIFTYLSEKRIIIVWVRVRSSSTNSILHINIIIYCNNPWSSSHKKSNSVNCSWIFLLS